MDGPSLTLLAALMFFISAALSLAIAFAWRSERDRAVGALRAFESRGWYAAPPSSIRLRGHRVDTSRATVLPPPPAMPRERGESGAQARDTWPTESVARVIEVTR